jgi:inner membrane protein
MDSITQAVLGAAIGEVTLGRKVGNKAIIWGAVAGTIPDLDVLFSDFYDTVDALFMHRGFSHSILFALIMSPVLGMVIHWIHKKSTASFFGWSTLVFWAFFTHILLDSLTSYGTGLFVPFSDYRIELNTIAIVDVFYTVPLLLSIIIILFFKRNSHSRYVIGRTGLFISTLYLVFTMVNKQISAYHFTLALDEQNISYNRIRVAPLPLTNFLWMGIAENEEGYYRGYYSMFDNDKNISFRFLPRQEEKLSEVRDMQNVEKLLQFTKGYYQVDTLNNEKLVVHDLRFGTLGFGDDSEYIFSFEIKHNTDSVTIEQREMEAELDKSDFQEYLARIKGNNID